MSTKLIKYLSDLDGFRSAPELTNSQSESLKKELHILIKNSSWFTIGIMASSTEVSIKTLREIEKEFSWFTMKIVEKPFKDGPVFLKANQLNKEVRVRIEYGLGEGILISCHHTNPDEVSTTIGPLPLDFFKLQILDK